MTDSAPYAPPCPLCPSRCCRYVAIEIDRPRRPRDHDQIRWFLHHQNVQVFVDHDGAWHVEFVTPCKELRGHRCGIYETRPQICRDYAASPDEPCEQMHSPYKRLFRDVAEYDAWRSENLARAAARRRSAVARTRR